MESKGKLGVYLEAIGIIAVLQTLGVIAGIQMIVTRLFS